MEKPISRWMKLKKRAEAAEAKAQLLARQLEDCKSSKKRVTYIVEPHTVWHFDSLDMATKKRDELFWQGCTFVRITTKEAEP